MAASLRANLDKHGAAATLEAADWAAAVQRDPTTPPPTHVLVDLPFDHERDQAILSRVFDKVRGLLPRSQRQTLTQERTLGQARLVAIETVQGLLASRDTQAASGSSSTVVPPPAKRARVENATSAATNHSVKLGSCEIHGYGMGTMPLGVLYPDPTLRPSETQAQDMIRAAVEKGVRFFDTADTYGPDRSDLHYCERLVASALKDIRKETKGVVLATKGGMTRINADSRGWRPKRLTPQVIRNCVEDSLESLNKADPSISSLDLWQLHHPPSKDEALVAIAKELAVLKREGKVRMVGLCNVTLRQVETVSRYVQVACVQNCVNPWDRAAEKPLPPTAAKSSKKGVLPFCQENGLVFLPHGIFGGTKARRGEHDLERDFPKLVALANQKGCSAHALFLRFMREKWPCILHIPGMRRPERLAALGEAESIEWGSEDLQATEDALLRRGQRS